LAVKIACQGGGGREEKKFIKREITTMLAMCYISVYVIKVEEELQNWNKKLEWEGASERGKFTWKLLFFNKDM
jgi:hypothetical protein